MGSYCDHASPAKLRARNSVREQQHHRRVRCGRNPHLRHTTSRWLDSCFAIINKTRESPVRFVLGVLLLFVLVFVVYRPMMPGKFLMDDHRLIREDNPLVNGELTPLNIWFQTDFTLSTFALWLQWLAWGESPGGYHVVNMLLHGLSAFLLWRLLTHLKIPGAWLAAADFCGASGLRQLRRPHRRTQEHAFPAVFAFEFLVVSPLRRGYRESRRRKPEWPPSLAPPCRVVARPFAGGFRAGAAEQNVNGHAAGGAARLRTVAARTDHTAGYFTAESLLHLVAGFWADVGLVSKTSSPGHVPELTLQPESFWQRSIGAGRDFWFYLGKALLPANLSIVYVRWKLDATTLTSFLPLILLGAGSVLCWQFRRNLGTGAHCSGWDVFL